MEQIHAVAHIGAARRLAVGGLVTELVSAVAVARQPEDRVGCVSDDDDVVYWYSIQ
jgi:hypothetical protein